MRTIAGVYHYSALPSARRALRPGGCRRGGAQVNLAWRPRDAALTVPRYGGDATQASAWHLPRRPAALTRSRAPRRLGPPARPHAVYREDALLYGGAGTRLPRGSAPPDSAGPAAGDWLSGRAPRSHRGGHWFDPSIAH